MLHIPASDLSVSVLVPLRHWQNPGLEQTDKRLERDGYEPVLKHSRWCLLKREENLTEKRAVKLSELLQYNLQSVRSRLMREDFQRFWEYCYPACAAYLLSQECVTVVSAPPLSDPAVPPPA